MIEFNHTEETTFHSHIAHFTACKHFLDHVSEVFDGNSSGGITLVEWHSFFNSPGTIYIYTRPHMQLSLANLQLGSPAYPNQISPLFSKLQLPEILLHGIYGQPHLMLEL